MGTPPVKRKSKAPLIISVIAGVVVLMCIGGIALVMFAANEAKNDLDAAVSATGAAKPKPSVETSDESVRGDLDRYKTGDCLTISSTNRVSSAKCTDTGAYKVLLRKDGTIADSACDSTDATDTLTQDGTGTSKDFILCIAPVK